MEGRGRRGEGRGREGNRRWGGILGKWVFWGGGIIREGEVGYQMGGRGGGLACDGYGYGFWWQRFKDYKGYSKMSTQYFLKDPVLLKLAACNHSHPCIPRCMGPIQAI